MRLVIAAWAGVLAFALSAPAFAGDADELHPKATAEAGHLKVGDLDRSYLFYKPKKLKGAPLVFVLHGSGGSGAEIERTTGYGFDLLADRYGFGVIYPDGFEGNWNDCRRAATYPARSRHVDDEGFLYRLVADLVKQKAIDVHKVFAVGYSNGAQMAFRLALEKPAGIAGIAAISAGLPAAENLDCYTAGQSMPVMIINGTEDPLNPFDGGEVVAPGMPSRGKVLSTADTIAYFARLDGQVSAPQVTRLTHQDPADPTWVEESDWAMPRRPEIVLYTVHGGGHVVPQPVVHYPPTLGRQTEDLNAPVAIWDFFARIAGIPEK